MKLPESLFKSAGAKSTLIAFLDLMGTSSFVFGFISAEVNPLFIKLVVEKSSTKKPDLNLLRPSESCI